MSLSAPRRTRTTTTSSRWVLFLLFFTFSCVTRSHAFGVRGPELRLWFRPFSNVRQNPVDLTSMRQKARAYKYTSRADFMGELTQLVRVKKQQRKGLGHFLKSQQLQLSRSSWHLLAPFLFYFLPAPECCHLQWTAAPHHSICRRADPKGDCPAGTACREDNVVGKQVEAGRSGSDNVEQTGQARLGSKGARLSQQWMEPNMFLGFYRITITHHHHQSIKLM